MIKAGDAGGPFRLPVGRSGEAWWMLPSGPESPARNMAVDEALLESVAGLRAPVLRTYAWTVPAATFGYFQRHAEVAEWTPLRPLIRRPTGGGVVPHDDDWTYSLAVPPGHPWYELSAVESYQRVHHWLQAAFGTLGLKTELAPCCDPQGPGRCFVGAERFDLLYQGRKLAGAAQRRNRMGLLIQGSVQPAPRGIDRAAWEAALGAVASESSGIRWEPFQADEAFQRRVDALVAEKYASAAYLTKR